MSYKAFRVTYWGTTGSLAAPLLPAEVTDKIVHAITHLLRDGGLNGLGPNPTESAVRQRLEQHLPFPLRSTYGGNTTCVEIETPDSLIILDSGSGARQLGIELAHRWSRAEFTGQRMAHLLLSHAHMDHTFAVPFVDIFYDPRNYIKIWAPRRVLESLNNLLDPQSKVRGLYFPPTYEFLQAIREFQAIEAGDSFEIGGTRVSTLGLNHPGGSLGFCLERDGAKIVFASDHEQVEDPDPALGSFAKGADLLYTDSQYLRDEYLAHKSLLDEVPVPRRGWGHSTVEGCVATAVAARVRQLHLGHREPKRNDMGLHGVEDYARDLLRRALRETGRPVGDCSVEVAYEGLTVQI